MRFYQRLVVNPFLSAMAVLAALLVFHALDSEARQELGPGLAIVGCIAAIAMLQYHCLDCGATGSYHRRQRHACPRVVERWMTPLSAASHFFPMPTTQLVLWSTALVVGLVLFRWHS